MLNYKSKRVIAYLFFILFCIVCYFFASYLNEITLKFSDLLTLPLKMVVMLLMAGVIYLFYLIIHARYECFPLDDYSEIELAARNNNIKYLQKIIHISTKEEKQKALKEAVKFSNNDSLELLLEGGAKIESHHFFLNVILPFLDEPETTENLKYTMKMYQLAIEYGADFSTFEEENPSFWLWKYSKTCEIK